MTIPPNDDAQTSTNSAVSPFLIFALTGFGQESDREAARKAGFDGHLTKPVDIDDVYALYVQRGSRWQSTRS